METEFARILQRLMAEHQLKATAIAQIAKVERQTVYNWLSGATPRNEPLALLCKHFKVTKAELMYGRAEYNNERLATIIEIVESAALEIGAELAPAKKAKLITMLYEKHASGEAPTTKEVSDLVALSA